MFFYLIQNSTLIETELDQKTKFIKLLIYGSISYIILHATLFIGDNNTILYSLKLYFWLFLILDCFTIYLLNKNTIDIPNILKIINNNNNNNTKNKNKNKNKKVSFSKNIKTMNYKNESDSDSDSEIGTDLDIDIESFKKSLDF